MGILTCYFLNVWGNNNDNVYSLTNPVDGLFNLTPCDYATVNTGTYPFSGTINVITSCPGGGACPP